LIKLHFKIKESQTPINHIWKYIASNACFPDDYSRLYRDTDRLNNAECLRCSTKQSDCCFVINPNSQHYLFFAYVDDPNQRNRNYCADK